MSQHSPRVRSSHNLSAQGEPMIWLSGGMFAIACLMIVCLLSFVIVQGLATLWPRDYLLLGLVDGQVAGGEFRERQSYVLSRQNLKDLDPRSRERAEILLADQSETGSHRWYLRTGNFEITNRHFQGVPEVSIASEKPYLPKEIWLLERRQWGNLYGFPMSLSWSTPAGESTLDAVRAAMSEASVTRRGIESAKRVLERLDRDLANIRLEIRKVELAEKSDLQSVTEQVLAAAAEANTQGTPIAEAIEPLLTSQSPRARRALERLARETLTTENEQVKINESLAELEAKNNARSVVMQLPITDMVGDTPLTREQWQGALPSIPDSLRDLLGLSDVAGGIAARAFPVSSNQVLVHLESDGRPLTMAWLVWGDDLSSASVYRLREHTVLVSDIVRLIEPNRLSWFGKIGVYIERWIEFLFGEPREAGVEGGVFPAIWGTVVMTLIMSLVVMPFGVLAALYMREYAKAGWLLSVIRISINNLAGVPSIVYGVFGLSFFCYTIGGYIDGGPIKAGFDPWPSGVWFSAMAILAIVGLVAFGVSILSGKTRSKSDRWVRVIPIVSGFLWIATIVGIVVLMAKTPLFHGFYEAQLPNPTFGKGCLLWAACTLALLTLPVVIVATEEALAAVPNSLREGSYACGAGKWQTIERIVLPYARPGIITGFILAMARGAGEVAPMMLVGAIPLAADLPLDLEFPFLHGSRSFMHLGFQIYALGFQSQNSEAAKPMVFTATLLLLSIVTLLNLTAIWLRARLRKRFQSSQF